MFYKSSVMCKLEVFIHVAVHPSQITKLIFRISIILAGVASMAPFKSLH